VSRHKGPHEWPQQTASTFSLLFDRRSSPSIRGGKGRAATKSHRLCMVVSILSSTLFSLPYSSFDPRMMLFMWKMLTFFSRVKIVDAAVTHILRNKGGSIPHYFILSYFIQLYIFNVVNGKKSHANHLNKGRMPQQLRELPGIEADRTQGE